MILAAGVGSGHNQAASAVEAALATLGTDDEVRRLDILETTNEVFNRLYDDAYFALVSEAPWLVGWGYDQADPPFKLRSIVTWLEQLNTIPFLREVRDYDPDVVICTHFLPARLVSIMLARRQLKATLTVVGTDYDFQGLWLTSPFHHFFAARDESRQYLTSIGIPTDRVSAFGIPVRPGLGDPVDREAVLQALRPASRPAGGADQRRSGRWGIHDADRRADAADDQPVPGGRRVRTQRRAEGLHRGTGGRPWRRATGCSATPPRWPT